MSKVSSQALPVVMTNHVEGWKIREYLGVVSGEAVLGSNFFRDFAAGVRDVVGGRVPRYEEAFRRATQTAIETMEGRAKELGADGVVGVDLDYAAMGPSGTLIMVVATGTAVKLARET